VTVDRPVELPDADPTRSIYQTVLVQCGGTFCRGWTEAGTGRKITWKPSGLPLVPGPHRARALALDILVRCPCVHCAHEMTLVEPVFVASLRGDVALCCKCLHLTEIQTGVEVTLQNRPALGRLWETK